MNIKGVAFDLEGTIVNVEAIHFDAFVRAAKEYGVETTFDEIVAKILHALGGGDKLISEGIAKMAQGKVNPPDILERKRYYYNEEVEERDDIQMREGFENVLKEIRAVGIPVSIASLTPPHQAELLLEKTGLNKLIPKENIVLEDAVKKLKPAPDVYLETAKRMNIEPSSQLAFEDSATGVLAARAAGSPVIALPVYTFEENISKLKKAGAQHIFLDWREIDIRAILKDLE